MVTERISGDSRYSDVLGYASFVERVESDHGFLRWFSRWSDDLDAAMKGEQQLGGRPILIQRALINLTDFFDPDWVRFPDPNERGRIPLPSGYQDRKRLRPVSEVARFRAGTEPFPMVESWAREYDLPIEQDGNVARVTLPRRWARPAHVTIIYDAPWVAIHVRYRPAPIRSNALPIDSGNVGIKRIRRQLGANRTEILNVLLRRLDRPTIPLLGHRSLLGRIT